MAVGVAGGVINMASSIETRGEGIGIAARGVVDTRVIGKPARVVSRIYSIQAARLHKPCGESRGCSADDKSRRECNLGLVQHCRTSLSRFRPARLGGRRAARRHPLNFRSENTKLEFSASYRSDEQCRPRAPGGSGYFRRLVLAGSGNSQALQLPRPLSSPRSASISQDCAISSMLAFNPGSASFCATAKQSAAFCRYFVYLFMGTRTATLS